MSVSVLYRKIRFAGGYIIGACPAIAIAFFTYAYDFPFFLCVITFAVCSCCDRGFAGNFNTTTATITTTTTTIRITLSARWKVNFPDGTSLLYRGDVVQDDEGTPLKVEAGGPAALGGNGFERPNAHIRGDVYKPVTTIQGTLTEKKIGEFEADLIELPRDTDKM